MKKITTTTITTTIILLTAGFLLLSGCGVKFETGRENIVETEQKQWSFEKKESQLVDDKDLSNFSQKYTNEKYYFSFNYPEGIVVSEFAEGEQGDIVLAQWNKNEANKKLAFQIFISEFDEPGPITAERIKQDLPKMIVDEPMHVIVTQNKLTALIFFSEEEGLGKTREIWLVNNGFLYQVITHADQDWLVGRVMEGWEFN